MLGTEVENRFYCKRGHQENKKGPLDDSAILIKVYFHILFLATFTFFCTSGENSKSQETAQHEYTVLLSLQTQRQFLFYH